MCGLMKTCDAAILPPSSVSYEWCSVSGLLFIHQIADNQKDMAAFLIQKELAYPLEEFERIINQAEMGEIMAQQVKRQREYFDGKSNTRLQRIFFDLILPDTMQLRTAEAPDMQLLFDWANDPEVRKHSFNPAPIPLEMHQHWFSSKLQDPDCLIFISLVAGKPAGMIRYDIKEKQATISYLLNKEFRGKGLGSWVLAAGTAALQQNWPDVELLIGHVQPSNLASVISFRKAGFTQTVDIPPAEPNSIVFAKSLK
jgi:UDP-2,4-diacetamido-2,4,6-trideoxy-beta-L-altropyranose hydrolase